MLHIQSHMAALDLSMFKDMVEGAMYQTYFILSHATWQAAMSDIGMSHWTWKVMCFIQVVVHYLNYNIPLSSKLIY